jgi:hypothetical protein
VGFFKPDTTIFLFFLGIFILGMTLLTLRWVRLVPAELRSALTSPARARVVMGYGIIVTIALYLLVTSIVNRCARRAGCRWVGFCTHTAAGAGAGTTHTVR